MFRYAFIPVFVVLAAMPGRAQFPSDVTAEPVADGIYMLTGPGGNIAVSTGDDAVLIVDDQLPQASDEVAAAISKLTDEPVELVLNTHWHTDHTGGNERFARTGAMIIAHENVRVRMSSSHYSEFFDSTTPPAPEIARPVVTYDNSATLHVNGLAIMAEHVPPAHTDGDSIVWFEPADVVHMGDTYFNGWYPYIDTASGGSITGMIGAVNHALERIGPETRVIPGHGPLSNRDELVAYRDMLVTVAGRIQKMIDEGRTLEDIVGAKPTAEFDEAWGNGFIKPEQWVELVYNSMTGS